MHDTTSVRFFERLGDLGSDLQCLFHCQRRTTQPRLQRLARDMLHHDAGAPVDVGQLVNLADKGVVERGGRPGLTVQPLARDRVLLEPLGQELDRHLATQLRVVGENTSPHAAPAEALEDAVAGRGVAHRLQGSRAALEKLAAIRLTLWRRPSGLRARR